MNTQDTTLPPTCGWPTMLHLFIEASATLIRQAQAAECNEHNYDQLLSAVQRVTDYGQKGLSALTKQAIAAQAPQSEKVLTEALEERDAASDYIDTLLDEVLGSDRSEWSSAYSHADAMQDVRERMTSLHKPAVDKAWARFQAGIQQAQGVPAGWRLAKVSDGDIRVYGPDKETWLIRNDCGEGFYEFIHRFFNAMIAAPQAAPVQAIEDPVTVPRSLLGAACAAITRKHDAPKTLAHLRRYTVGDLSAPQAEPQPEREPVAYRLKDEEASSSYGEPTYVFFCSSELKNMTEIPAALEPLYAAPQQAHGIGTKGGDK